MQLIPSTAKLVGCRDSYDARQNILGGANYLRMMLKRFEGSVKKPWPHIMPDLAMLTNTMGYHHFAKPKIM